MSICQWVNLFVTSKLGYLTVYPMIHILNQHDSGSALVHNSFASTVSLRNFSLTWISNRKSEVTAFAFGIGRAIKADQKWQLKLKISKASFESGRPRGRHIYGLLRLRSSCTFPHIGQQESFMYFSPVQSSASNTVMHYYPTLILLMIVNCDLDYWTGRESGPEA